MGDMQKANENGRCVLEIQHAYLAPVLDKVTWRPPRRTLKVLMEFYISSGQGKRTSVILTVLQSVRNAEPYKS